MGRFKKSFVSSLACGSRLNHEKYQKIEDDYGNDAVKDCPNDRLYTCSECGHRGIIQVRTEKSEKFATHFFGRRFLMNKIFQT